MYEFGIVVGSTRTGRNGEAVARWVAEEIGQRHMSRFHLVDLANYELPLLNEPLGARAVAQLGMEYTHEHTKKWSADIAALDGFVFVTPEYNFGPPAALKNALDYLYKEWSDKPAAFVSYGTAGGARAVAQLRQVCGELQMFDIRDAVELSLLDDFEDFTNFRPRPGYVPQLERLAAELERLAGPLQQLRKV